MFTVENTENSFTSSELAVMNAALEIRLARGEHESNASAAINNAFTPNCVVEDLV